MGVTTRRAVLSGAALLGGGTVAAAAWLRKPAPTFYSPVAEQVLLQSMTSLVPTEPAVPLPEFSFVDDDGASHTLAEFAGKGVVLNFWATWCVPCVAEMPSLAALAGKLAGSGIVVLPVSTDRGGAPVVRKFFTSHAVTGLGVWLDPKGVAADALHLRGLPTTLIVDRKGREAARLEGGADWAGADVLGAVTRLVG